MADERANSLNSPLIRGEVPEAAMPEPNRGPGASTRFGSLALVAYY
ncbi:hypothetical protein [Agromyces lapidis]|uniref:Uncharacterized protein n=1 Tax=Agromyces lapidis TaxID=279574 RepID=A0ABV5SN33_9MICO|nr:hypothetical protein [Agromyces lapidis]